MLTLLRWLARRPLRLLHALGAALGWLVWLLSPHYRRRLAANAALAGVGGRERRAAVAEAGRMSLETARLWLRPPGAPLPDPVQWEGAALLEQALEAGHGVVLLTPHLGSFEVRSLDLDISLEFGLQLKGDLVRRLVRCVVIVI